MIIIFTFLMKVYDQLELSVKAGVLTSFAENNYILLLHILTASTINLCSTVFKRSCRLSSVSPGMIATSSRQITGPASTSGVT